MKSKSSDGLAGYLKTHHFRASDKNSQVLSKLTWTTSMPLDTLPNTVCLLSSHGVATVVMKN